MRGNDPTRELAWCQLVVREMHTALANRKRLFSEVLREPYAPPTREEAKALWPGAPSGTSEPELHARAWTVATHGLRYDLKPVERMVRAFLKSQSMLCSTIHIQCESPLRWRSLLTGPYDLEPPSAYALHLFMHILAAFEPSLVYYIVDVLFRRMGVKGYPGMQQDPARIRAICQLFLMFSDAFQPAHHRMGLGSAIFNQRRRRNADDRRRRIIDCHLYPIKMLA